MVITIPITDIPIIHIINEIIKLLKIVFLKIDRKSKLFSFILLNKLLIETIIIFLSFLFIMITNMLPDIIPITAIIFKKNIIFLSYFNIFFKLVIISPLNNIIKI